MKIRIFFFCHSVFTFLTTGSQLSPVFCSEELSSLPCKNQNKSLSFSYLTEKFKFAVWWDHIHKCFFYQAHFISLIIILSLLIFLIKGCLQRLDYNVLVPFLQPKHEYVLCISLTPFQKKLYMHYLENFARAGQIGADGKLEGGRKGGLFYDVQNLSRVWNHPYILLKAKVIWYGFILNTQYTQCARTDLNKRFLPKPMTTTGWKGTP